MSTYRCAIDGLMPSEVCEYYRVDSRTCGAPDPDHCQDSLHDEDWRQREGAAEVSKMTIDEAIEVAERWSRETVITVGNNPLPYACVALAAEVRHLREREAKAREILQEHVAEYQKPPSELSVGNRVQIWMNATRWLETE